MGTADSTRSGDIATNMDRRQFLTSFVIAAASTLAVRAAEAAAIAPGTTSPTAADWQSVLETMFPHDNIDRALYAAPAGALASAAEKDPGTRQLLTGGWEALTRAAGGDWASAPQQARLRAIASIVGTPLFTLLRQTTVFTFYANPAVWKAFGYEGDAWQFGGYAGKELNTIDWLPEPPMPAQES